MMKQLLFTLTLAGLMSSGLNAQVSYLSEATSTNVGYEAHTFKIDDAALSDSLANALAIKTESARSQALHLTLPDPEGREIEMTFHYSPIMAPELAERYPNIRTYKVSGAGVNGRIGYTDEGFHGIFFTTQGTYYIDRVDGEEDVYHAYTRGALMAASDGKASHHCLLDDELANPVLQVESRSRGERQSGDKLRTYRLALACTGEYAQQHGGTTSSVLSSMVATMNRVNGVYERDFSVTMQLIGNNDDLIYFNSSTDPYNNSNVFAMLGENQANVDNVIGTSNYDIGHVFGVGGGGVASLASICTFGNKARGVTGWFASSNPDAFDIDYVAHEMGHQFGGNHTQNNDCNRNPSSAWEPGSASTIMGYAGICPPDLQTNSDDYFHSGNYDEIMDVVLFTDNSLNCPTVTNTGNTAPSVSVDAAVHTIPRETPFVLRGTAEDDEGDDLTYCWEQMDLGPTGSPTNPTGNAPIFRSWDPVDNGERTFPRLPSVLTGSTVIGETYPTYTRNLNFRMTVRDNNINGGGVDYDEVSMSVDGESGPFVVLTPVSGAQAQAGVYYHVEWDVAGTNATPVNCQEVHILLYSGNGIILEDTLAANVPNTGSAWVEMTSDIDGGYRVRVEAADNVFFNYNPGAFSVVTAFAPVGEDIILGVAPNFDEGGIDLLWNDPFNTENHWVVERSVGGNANFQPIDTLLYNTESYFDPNVNMLGTEYHYRVYAFNPAGNSAFSNEDSWLGVGVKELAAEGLIIYPNPVKDAVTIEWKGVRIASAKIYDEQGRLVHQLNKLDANGQLDVSHLNIGTYFVHLRSAQGETRIAPLSITR